MSEGNGHIGRDALLRPAVRRFRDVVIDGLGKVRIRTLNELERQRVESPNYRVNKKTGGVSANMDKIHDQNCRYIVACVVDANGEPLLRNEDIERLRQQDSSIIAQLTQEIEEFCGVTGVGAAEKNYETTPAGDSP